MVEPVPATIIPTAWRDPTGARTTPNRPQDLNGCRVSSDRAVRVAMAVAGVMVAHLIAGKAVRDAAFLSAWPVAQLPAMVTATALVVVAAVPIYSRLIERFGPRAV